MENSIAILVNLLMDFFKDPVVLSWMERFCIMENSLMANSMEKEHGLDKMDSLM